MFRKRKEAFLSSIGIDPAAIQRGAMSPAALQASMAYGQRLERITATGVEMPATLTSFSLGEPQPHMGGRTVSLELTVDPPGGTAYPVSTKQVLPDAISQTLAAGQRLTVKVAADDPRCLMLWNTPHAAGGADPETGRPVGGTAAPAPAGDRLERIAKLHELRTSGVLTEEEFQAQKAKLLAS
jgi:hypothetical protein